MNAVVKIFKRLGMATLSSTMPCANTRFVGAIMIGDPARLPCAIVFASILGLLFCGSSRATQFCVASESALDTALSVTQNDGINDEIDLVAGTIVLAQQLVYTTTSTASLRVVGGWNTGCTLPTAGASVLDGGGQQLIALFQSNGNIWIEGITVANGHPGLQVLSMGGDVHIERNVFFNNLSGGSASGGLFAGATVGHVWIRDNAFLSNSGGDGGGAHISGNGAELYISNNSFVANHTNTSGGAGGLYVDGSAHLSLSNNILWASAGPAALDFFSATANLRDHNDMGSWGGAVADSASTGDVNIDPGFVACTVFPCLDLRLGSGSPLVNAGLDNPPGALAALDLAGLPRVLGLHVDIGAYEQDRIFMNGFELAP